MASSSGTRDMVQCFCMSYACNGKPVSKRTFQRHSVKDVSISDAKRPKIATQRESQDLYPVGTLDILDQPLFKGSKMTVLTAIHNNLKTFVDSNGMTKAAISRTLGLHRESLPMPNNMPESYEKAVSLIESQLMPLMTVEACRNDCVVFKQHSSAKDYSDIRHCPVCSENRATSKNFCYMPIAPRLKRWFGEANLAQLVQTGPLEMSYSGDVSDFKESTAYQSWFKSGGPFFIHKGDDSGIPLSLFTDGLNPNRNISLQRSMWPLIVTWLSLPPTLRTELGTLMVYGIIPGDMGHEPRTLDPYVELIVDECLNDISPVVFNAHINAPVAIKMRILMYQCDLPAICKLLHFPGQMSIRCFLCNHSGQYSKVLHKVVHMGNVRFTTSGSHPKSHSKSDEVSLRREYDALPNKTQRMKFQRQHGLQGTHPLMKQPEYNAADQVSPDGMHTLVDVCDNIYKLVVGITDTAKARQYENEQGRFSDFFHEATDSESESQEVQPPRRTHRKDELTSSGLVKAPWSLVVGELKTADMKASCLIIPKHYELPGGPYFTKNSLKKMHSRLKFFTEYVFLWCVKDYIEEEQWNALVKWCDCLNKITSHSIGQDIDDTINLTSQTLHTIEMVLPLTLQNITTHITHHLARDLKWFGPLHHRWCFPYERALCWLSRRALNKCHQESTIMATYRIYDWCHFMDLKLKTGPPTPVANDGETATFKGKATKRSLGQDVVNAIHSNLATHIPTGDIQILQYTTAVFNKITYSTDSFVVAFRNNTYSKGKHVKIRDVLLGKVSYMFQYTQKVFVCIEVLRDVHHDGPFITGLESHTDLVTIPLENVSAPLIVAHNGNFITAINAHLYIS